MKNKLDIIYKAYGDACFGWRYLIKEINIILLFTLLLPVLALSLLSSLISSIMAVIILLIAIIIHYIVIYFLISNITGKYFDLIEYKPYISDLFLLSKSKYWTNQRFYKFIYLIKKNCDSENLNVIEVLSNTKMVIKTCVDVFDKKEKIISAPRRSLTLWLLAPVVGIFTAIFQEICKPAFHHGARFYYIIILSYMFIMVVYVSNEIFNSEYNREYKQLELLNFIECAEIYFQPDDNITEATQIDSAAI